MSECVRAFVSIELDDSLRKRLKELQVEFKKVNRRVRWIKAENLHLTLSFLGNIEVSEVDEVSRTLDRIVSNFRRFDLEVRGVGYFGRCKKPTVIWAGIEHSERLMKLQSDITAGLKLESREFTPHITLSRVKESSGLSSVVDKIEAKSHLKFGSLPVKRVVLMKSELSHNGAKYSEIKSFLLR